MEDSLKAWPYDPTVGYAAALLVIATVFSDRLGDLTVALGVAGAGVAT